MNFRLMDNFADIKGFSPVAKILGSVDADAPIHQYGALLAELPEDIAGSILSLADFVDDDDVIKRECFPHITVYYGFDDTVVSGEISKMLIGQGPLFGNIGRPEVFKDKDADVLVYRVESPLLEGLNKRFELVFGEMKKEFKPHITVAYLKKGTGQKYLGLNWIDDSWIYINRLMYSDCNEQKTLYFLTGKNDGYAWASKSLVTRSREYTRDDNGRFAPDSGGSFGGDEGELSNTGEPPSKTWRDPPAPRNSGSGRAGGFTADGITNTQFGDLAELAAQKFGLQSLLPPGKRQNPLDVRLSGTNFAFEIKAVSVRSSEYKIKMKAHEVKSKVKYAKKHGLRPGVMIVVMDLKNREAHAYWRKGIGNFRLTKSPDWNYMGTVRLPKVAA